MASAAILETLLPVLRTIFFASHWPVSHIILVKKIASIERRLDSVVMAVINSQRELPEPRIELATS